MAKKKKFNPIPEFVYEYHNKIQSGEIIAGKWVKLAYEMLVKGIEDGRYIYNPKKAALAINFIEMFCRHHESTSQVSAGDLIELELWQKAMLQALYGFYYEDGSRCFWECLLVCGRKNGKSTLLSAIADMTAFTNGRGTKIYMLATTLEQASICYNGAYQMITQEPELYERIRKRRTDIYIPEIDSTIKPLAFNGGKHSDGKNPDLVICDECAAWPAVTGTQQYNVMRSAFGAKKAPLILSITTSGYIYDGPFDSLMKRGQQLLLGNSDERRLLPLIYMIDDETKWEDMDEIRKANPNLGVSLSEDAVEEELRIAHKDPKQKVEFLTKRCNIHQNMAHAFFSAKMIRDAFQKVIPIAEMAHNYCVMGVDLSRTTDLTSLSTVIEKDGILNVFTKFWIPGNKVQEAIERDGLPYDIYISQGYVDASGGDVIDYHDITNYITHLINDYEILPAVIGYDKYSATYFVTEVENYGIQMDDVRQGFNLTSPINEMNELLLNKKINIADENPLMKVHLANSALKKNSNGQSMIVKIKEDPATHIDGTLSLIDAITVRQKWYEQYGQTLKNES